MKNAGIYKSKIAKLLKRLPKTPKDRKNKTDEKDAMKLLELLRGHVLAGNDLPDVWVPDPETRDDREIVRARLDAREKATAAVVNARKVSITIAGPEMPCVPEMRERRVILGEVTNADATGVFHRLPSTPEEAHGETPH